MRLLPVPLDDPVSDSLYDSLTDNHDRILRLCDRVHAIDRELEDIHWFTWLYYSPILRLQRHIHVTNIRRLVHQRECMNKLIYRPPPEHNDSAAMATSPASALAPARFIRRGVPFEDELTADLFERMMSVGDRILVLINKALAIDKQLESMHWLAYLLYGPVLRFQRSIHLEHINRLSDIRDELEAELFPPPPPSALHED